MSADPAPEAGGAPLLIACALGIERFALRGAGPGAAGEVTVVRTGMGPQSAERAVTRALTAGSGGSGEWRTAVIATGFCAGLAPGMHPGDLVVADETRDPAGRTVCTGTRILADALSRPLPGGPAVPCTSARSWAPTMWCAVRSGPRCTAPEPSRWTWSPPRPCAPPSAAASVRLRPSGWSWTLLNMNSSELAPCAVEYRLSGFYEPFFPLSFTGTVLRCSQEVS